jgi:hypothetical protein
VLILWKRGTLSPNTSCLGKQIERERERKMKDLKDRVEKPLSHKNGGCIWRYRKLQTATCTCFSKAEFDTFLLKKKPASGTHNALELRLRRINLS